MVKTPEFAEVAHSGGKVTFTVVTSKDGQANYKVGFSSSRPVPMSMIGLYALPVGVPVSLERRLGWPQMDGPPFSGCLLVLVASDSHGLFGHKCPRCEGYWRSGPWADFCPYCALQADTLDFLSDAQRKYIGHYCQVLSEALASQEDGEVVIDMDAVADAVSDPENRPAFFVSEESQQHKFKCAACNSSNDILGTYGYCSVCATRNDLSIFESETVPKLRERVNADTPPEDCVRDAVAAIDSFIGQYGQQLAERIPLMKGRRNRLIKSRFHDLDEVSTTFEQWFGINLLAGVSASDAAFAKLMFHRRHLYEHKGGEADEKYIRDSGEAGVRVKQRLRNSKEDAHRLLAILQRLASNLHNGFHELLPPASKPIAAWQERQSEIARRR